MCIEGLDHCPNFGLARYISGERVIGTAIVTRFWRTAVIVAEFNNDDGPFLLQSYTKTPCSRAIVTPPHFLKLSHRPVEH
jgi:hypothetical protein